METKVLSPFLVFILTTFHFSASSVIPIYNKELFHRVPFPLYATFIQTFSSILPSFVIAWFVRGCPLSFEWAIPPKAAFPNIFVSSILYGMMMLLGNLGFYVSDLDFAVLFRVSTIVTSGFCGIFFLRERVSLEGGVGILLVIRASF